MKILPTQSFQGLSHFYDLPYSSSMTSLKLVFVSSYFASSYSVHQMFLWTQTILSETYLDIVAGYHLKWASLLGFNPSSRLAPLNRRLFLVLKDCNILLRAF